MASPRPPIFSLWLIQSHLHAINIRGCLFYYQTLVMIVHVCITCRLNGEKEKWCAEQADEKLLCLPVCTTYYRLQDTEQAKGGRKPKVLALLGVLKSAIVWDSEEPPSLFLIILSIINFYFRCLPKNYWPARLYRLPKQHRLLLLLAAH